MDSKKMEDLANEAEKDIQTLLEMYKKYTGVQYEMRKKHTENKYDDVFNDIRMTLFFLQNDLQRWLAYYKNKKVKM